MGQFTLNICITSDGTYVYGIGDTAAYTVPSTYIPYNAPTQHVLVKSVANPTSYENAGWTFLASVPASSSLYFTSSTPAPGFQCRVDSRGVFTLTATTTTPAGSTTTTTHIRGLQWDPLGTNTIANATGSGGWSVLDSTSTIILDWTAPATLALFNTTPTLVYLDSFTLLDFATLDPATKIFNWQSTSWNLQTLGLAYNLEFLEYGNNKLYMLETTSSYNLAGGISANMTLITKPLTAVETTPAVSALTKSSASTIYHHDGVNWTTPMSIPAVPWNTPGVSRFVRSPDGTTWAYLEDYNSAYTITISNSSATWTRVGGVNITEKFGTVPTATITPSSGSGSTVNSTSGSNGGIGGGAVAGIIVGVIVVLAGVFLIFRRGKNKSSGAAQAPLMSLDPSKTPSPVAIAVAPSVPVAQHPLAYPDGTQQYTGYYQQPVPGSTFPATQPYAASQPYPVAQPYSQYSAAPTEAAYPSAVPQIPLHLSVAPQVSPNLPVASQGTSVSSSTVTNSPHQTNLGDIQFSVHPRPNIVQGSTYESTTASTPSSIPDQTIATTASVPPALANHSRPNASPNNPQYHPL
ncbi:hypothetical protein BGX20_008441 [Mortierella sp. AD010]|nr:hypothetical protein BGX20_008441 [Mortierella sp. AD010]